MLKLNDWKDAPAHLQLEARAAQAAGWDIFTLCPRPARGCMPVPLLYVERPEDIQPRPFFPLRNFEQALGLLGAGRVILVMEDHDIRAFGFNAPETDRGKCDSWEHPSEAIAIMCRLIVEAAGQTIN